MRTRNKVLLGVCILLAAAALAVIGRYCCLRYEYPYGRTHRCSRCIILALMQYAGDHDDKFPHSGTTPEASLYVLCKDRYLTVPYDLISRRKTDKEMMEIGKMLDSGAVLDPDTCEWHYEDRIDHDASSEIAVLWGKSDLGHVGQRLHGGHEAAFNDGHIEVIPASRWKEFLAEQEKMVTEYLAEKKKESEKSTP